jgi:C4-dicarboxylate transporter DctM subunit
VLLIGATALVLLLLAMLTGAPVAACLGLVALVLDLLFSTRPLNVLDGDLAWAATTNFVFIAVPLFILTGEILVRSGLTERMYNALAAWVTWIPGGLLHTNIVSCSLFAAVSGSSVATAATVGTVALPTFQRKGYSEKVVLGSLAAGGTLGILIPPSLKMIVYALLTDNSVGRLFLAGFIPGFMLAGMFMAAIAIMSIINPRIAPKEAGVTWGQRVKGTIWIFPIGSLLVVIHGSIYLGLATPSEAAALGVVGALALSAFSRRLSIKMLTEALEGTSRITGMVVLILVFASIFNTDISALGLTAALAQGIGHLALPPLAILGAIVVFYLVAGCFLDDGALTWATIPLVYPIILQLAKANPDMQIFDGVAFGILFVVLMEAAIISPPYGINLFVIHGIRRTRGPMSDVFIGIIPFFLCMLVMIGVIIAFPQIALWLPSVVFGGH